MAQPYYGSNAIDAQQRQTNKVRHVEDNNERWLMKSKGKQQNSQ